MIKAVPASAVTNWNFTLPQMFDLDSTKLEETEHKGPCFKHKRVHNDWQHN